VIVDDANFVGLTRFPPEYDAPLLVYANAMEATEIASKCLEAIAGWRLKILKSPGRVQHIELAHRD
jgi:hypothetical protein